MSSEPQITLTLDTADAQCLYAALGKALNPPTPAASTASPSVAADAPKAEAPVAAVADPTPAAPPSTESATTDPVGQSTSEPAAPAEPGTAAQA